MIVFVNGPPVAGKRRVCQALVARYQRAALVDLDRLTEASAMGLVESCQQRGVADFVVCGVFETPAALAQPRRALGQLDDVTYAFRLCYPRSRLDDAALESSGSIDAAADRGDVGYPIDAGGTAEATAAAIWDNIHEEVAVVDPDPRWRQHFEQERAVIATQLGDRAVALHHIGSTAVAGLVAKPVIDIMVALDRLEHADECIAPLRRIGYVFVDYPQNTDRRFFRKGEPRTHHLHLVARDSRSLADHIAFRDALRGSPQLRDAYAELKRSLAGEHRDDRAAYSAKKTKFIATVLGHAPR